MLQLEYLRTDSFCHAAQHRLLTIPLLTCTLLNGLLTLYVSAIRMRTLNCTMHCGRRPSDYSLKEYTVALLVAAHCPNAEVGTIKIKYDCDAHLFITLL